MPKEYVDKQALLEDVHETVVFSGSEECILKEFCGAQKVISRIKAAPAADVVEVIHSKWEISSDGYYPFCKHCNHEPKNGVMSKFCPECGAKMDNHPRSK